MEKFNLERLLNVKDIPFVFGYKIYLIIKKIKAKFWVGESKHMCGHCKIIWVLIIECNTHIQICFKIIHRGFQ
jgi:hypothetical protein